MDIKRQQTIYEHQNRIRHYRRLQQFEAEARELLKQFLFEECCRLEQTAALRSQAEQFLRERRILQPAARNIVST